MRTVWEGGKCPYLVELSVSYSIVPIGILLSVLLSVFLPSCVRDTSATRKRAICLVNPWCFTHNALTQSVRPTTAFLLPCLAIKLPPTHTLIFAYGWDNSEKETRGDAVIRTYDIYEEQQYLGNGNNQIKNIGAHMKRGRRTAWHRLEE